MKTLLIYLSVTYLMSTPVLLVNLDNKVSAKNVIAYDKGVYGIMIAEKLPSTQIYCSCHNASNKSCTVIEIKGNEIMIKVEEIRERKIKKRHRKTRIVKELVPSTSDKDEFELTCEVGKKEDKK